jgi:hypothetical protein
MILSFWCYGVGGDFVCGVYYYEHIYVEDRCEFFMEVKVDRHSDIEGSSGFS